MPRSFKLAHMPRGGGSRRPEVTCQVGAGGLEACVIVGHLRRQAVVVVLPGRHAAGADPRADVRHAAAAACPDARTAGRAAS